MKKILFAFFAPCILLAQASNTVPAPTGMYNQGSNGGGGSAYDPNARLRSMAESNTDKCPFLSADTVPGDSELRGLLSSTVTSLQSQAANSPACASVGTYISQIYMSLYGVPLKKDDVVPKHNDMQDQNGQQSQVDQTPQPTRSGGCLNSSSKRIDPAKAVNEDPDCASLIFQLEALHQQLQNCNLKDQAAIAANIGQLTVGVGMILGGNAAVTAAGALVQIGSTLARYIVPTKLQKAQKFVARINKIEADTLLENAMNCYSLSMYKGLYCNNEFRYKRKYEELLVKYAPVVKKSLKRDILEQHKTLKQIDSDNRYSGYDPLEQERNLIRDCYNGYVFLNYKVKRGAIDLEDTPKPFFRKYCIPLTECTSSINMVKQKNWGLPVLFTKGWQFNFKESCDTLQKAQALAVKSTSKNIATALIEDNFDGRTCNASGATAFKQGDVTKDELAQEENADAKQEAMNAGRM